jgi:hypothetical protein
MVMRLELLPSKSRRVSALHAGQRSGDKVSRIGEAPSRKKICGAIGELASVAFRLGADRHDGCYS